jgi:collagenase-like PrtC family protease
MTISLELLAPAGNADIGIAAIDHGADAVYIGAPRFGARADAGVTASEIARLIRHAHFYYAKVYVALNTILTDDEIRQSLDIIREIHDAGADGLIIQDPGLLEMDLPPIPLIASTQMHNDTLEKIQFLEGVGFKRVILARELSLAEIVNIRKNTKIELEAFVYGALCVSYSGQCYMSQAVAGRSGNRGVCAQPCRSRYTLRDGDGKSILADKFLLSLRDLNLIHDIPALAASGITSFKIEGRYKEIDYVKNVTAAFSRAINDFIREYPDYHRSSSGRSEHAFSPDPAKTFNRGYSRYFLSGEREKLASMDTQKSIGQPIGKVTGLGKGFFQTNCTDLENGDGLCFFTKEGELAGFRVEQVRDARIYPNTMKDLNLGISLYRNRDIGFTRILKKTSAQRQIGVEMLFLHEGEGVRLTVYDEDGNSAEVFVSVPYQKPRDVMRARMQIEKQLSSTGDTLFKVLRTTISGRIGFYSLSFLNGIKRQVLAELKEIRLAAYSVEHSVFFRNDVPYPQMRLDFHANVLNSYSRGFYKRHGVEVVEPAFEMLTDIEGREVMRTRYCILHQLNACSKSNQRRVRFKEPLRISDGHHSYLLRFDCEKCQMSVVFVGKK